VPISKTQLENGKINRSGDDSNESDTGERKGVSAN
jgi:hypothetical protein